jgi:ubiquinol-cytochrome c reductase cytochrome b subunit
MISKVMISLFCVVFVTLGYMGMQSGSTTQTWIARGLTLFYFGFFVSMPIWSRLGATKPVPDRVTMHD